MIFAFEKRSLNSFLFIFLFISMVCQQAYSQKIYQAARISSNITCDGRLDEDDWLGREAMGDFIQNNPIPGAKATLKSEVKILYDDDAIYIGAKLYDNEPSNILKELTIRDQSGNADRFGISFDTYADGINAFNFEVSASGVQVDRRITADDEDRNWDAVWMSEVRIDDDGWTVEMIIPYNAVRFPKKDIQTWKVQPYREIRRLREFSTWNEIKPEVNGEVNQYGVLSGITNIKSPFRLALTPYLSTYFDRFAGATPEESINSFRQAAGLDLKYGINDAFTLDMTLVPDFGQVISDQQILNLTPFEVFFEENRPFFTEGLELYNKGNMFYSRRLGGQPIGYNNAYNVGGTVISNPSQPQLINVSKLSGRNSKGLGIGVFNGVEAQSFAEVQYENGSISKVLTNPYTNYSVLVLDQNLKNNSNISITNTNVSRRGDFKDANSTGVFLKLNDKNQEYGLNFGPIVSNVYTPEGVKRGFKYDLTAGKISGNWVYSLENTVESDKFDINDAGFLRNPNEVSASTFLGYNNYKPKNSNIISYRYAHYLYGSKLYKPFLFNNFGTGMTAFYLMKSRVGWGAEVQADLVTTRDYFEPRRGDFKYFLGTPPNIRFESFVSSDYRKKLAVDARIEIEEKVNSDWADYRFRLAPRYRFNNSFTMVLSANTEYSKNQLGYFNSNFIDKQAAGLAKSEVVMGVRDRLTVNSVLSSTYIFNKNLGLDARIRHYWAEVTYSSYGNLSTDGVVDRVINPDVDILNRINNNFNIFNIDLQLRWRFALGSDLFFVWKQSVSSFNREVVNNYFQNIGNNFSAPQNNSLSVRAIYWLDVNRFKS